MNKLVLIISVLIITASINADDPSDAQRIVRMQATIDELTLRVAELKQENNRLQAAVEDALKASRSGRSIVTGCNVDEIAQTIAFESSPNSEERLFMAWVKKNGSNCTAEQLLQLRQVASSLLLSAEPIKAVTYLQSRQ